MVYALKIENNNNATFAGSIGSGAITSTAGISGTTGTFSSDVTLDTNNKLKALKIAEELADKSTLPILRKGLRDISPEVVEISALLIRQFK